MTVVSCLALPRGNFGHIITTRTKSYKIAHADKKGRSLLEKVVHGSVTLDSQKFHGAEQLPSITAAKLFHWFQKARFSRNSHNGTSLKLQNKASRAQERSVKRSRR